MKNLSKEAKALILILTLVSGGIILAQAPIILITILFIIGLIKLSKSI